MTTDLTPLAKAADSPAGSTIMKVIGAMLPRPLIEPFRERIAAVDTANKIDAAVGDALAKRLALDEEVLERARERFIRSEYKKQESREAVASVALEQLGGENIDEEAATPDDDWINIFNGYAEDASSDRMRLIFGRILAGEIRKPGSFSASTMRIMAEMDQSMATDVARLSDLLLDEVIYANDEWAKGDLLNFATRLKTDGLLSDNVANINLTLNFGDAGYFYLPSRTPNYGLLLKSEPKTVINMPVLSTTRSCRQILSILGSPSDYVTIAQGIVDLCSERLSDRNRDHKIWEAVMVVKAGEQYHHHANLKV